MRTFLAVAALMVGTANAQDPTGFTEHLNAARAERGLAPVAYNPAAVGVAAENNRLQAIYGLGHHYVGSYGQVAAVGVEDARAALAAWADSPAHAALLFAPDLVSVAFHAMDGVATASTQQSFAVQLVQPAVQWYYQPPGWRFAR